MQTVIQPTRSSVITIGYLAIPMCFIGLLCGIRFFCPEQPLRPISFVLFTYLAPIFYLVLGILKSGKSFLTNTLFLVAFGLMMSVNIGDNSAESAQKQITFLWPIYMGICYASGFAIMLIRNHRKQL